MNKRLENKKIIITGASSGLGRQLALTVAKRGGIPILLARSIEQLELLKQEIAKIYKINAYVYQIDLIKQIELDHVLDVIIEEHEQISALINNAGLGVFTSLVELKMTDVEQMLRLNVLALIQITQKMVAHFLTFKAGHIINIGSQAGKLATPKASAYVASKHAVIGFTNSLRQEVQKDGIFVTSVNTGPVRTEFFKHADPTGEYEKSIARYMLDPELLAQKVIQILFTRKREINLPHWMEFGSRLYQLMPNMMETLLKKQFHKK